MTGLIFVEQRADTPDWEAHVAPQRQWVMALRGRVAITVSNGERREFDPGEPILVEDVAGEGHVSTPLTPEFAFIMIPCSTDPPARDQTDGLADGVIPGTAHPDQTSDPVLSRSAYEEKP